MLGLTSTLCEEDDISKMTGAVSIDLVRWISKLKPKTKPN